MKKERSSAGKGKNIETVLDRISRRNKAPFSVYLILLALYVASTVIISSTAGMKGDITIFGAKMGIYAMAGIFSALSNIFIMLIVVYFGKLGFLTALIALVAQMPMLFYGIIAKGNMSSLPGLFTGVFTIIAIIIIYINNKMIDKAQIKMRDQAVTDNLTNLPNRFACSELVSDLIQKGEKFTFVSIDINNFKSINDTMGRNAGNDVLIELASRWKNSADSDKTGTLDFVTRQSGDEFSLIIRDYSSEEDVLDTIKHYQLVLEKKITVEECDLYLNACFGYAEYPTFFI